MPGHAASAASRPTIPGSSVLRQSPTSSHEDGAEDDAAVCAPTADVVNAIASKTVRTRRPPQAVRARPLKRRFAPTRVGAERYTCARSGGIESGYASGQVAALFAQL